MYFLLFYDYVDNVLERRAPQREAHLALVREYADSGQLVLARAFADPVDGAALAFTVKDRARVEGVRREGSLCRSWPRDRMADPAMDGCRRFSPSV